MSPSTNPIYTLPELADLAGVTPRTVRYYVTQGLLPGPGAVGPGPKYDDTDLARLRLIRRLQRDHQPLAEIRRHLSALSDDAIVAATEQPAAPAPDSALDYIRRVTGITRGTAPAVSVMPAAPAAPSMRAMEGAPSEPAAPAEDVTGEPRVERSQWERVVLAPDVELHIRRPLTRSTAKRVDRLIAIARDLLKEDLS